MLESYAVRIELIEIVEVVEGHLRITGKGFVKGFKIAKEVAVYDFFSRVIIAMREEDPRILQFDTEDNELVDIM